MLIDWIKTYLGLSGILRTKGRVNAVGYTIGAIILPPESRVRLLIVRFYHEKYHHLAHETMINDIKYKFYTLRLRVQHKSVRKACQLCKICCAMPQPPKTRLTSFEKPFTCTGVDYIRTTKTVQKSKA